MGCGVQGEFESVESIVIKKLGCRLQDTFYLVIWLERKACRLLILS